MNLSPVRAYCFPAALLMAGIVSLPLFAQRPQADNPISVIIGFNHPPGASEAALIRAAGGIVRRTYRIIPAVAAILPPAVVRALENHPSISVIEPDVLISTFDEYSAAWGVAKIGAQAVHAASINGLGTKVCVIDTGIDISHPDLAGRFIGGYDFINNTNTPLDDNGHGTHVAGTIAAVLNGAGVVGAAPGAAILAYKAFDAGGVGPISNVIAAMDLCKQAGAQVTNNSYGVASDPGTLFKAAFDTAAAAGMINVAASGNAASAFSTCGTVMYPARYGSVIAVAATDAADVVPIWSCRGPEVELAAPGDQVWSTWPFGTYAVLSGTSMAAPHAAGVAALVLDCGLTQDLNGDGRIDGTDVRLRMQQTALDLGAAGRDTSYGFGRVRANQAALSCTGAPPPVPPPAAPTGLKATATGRNNIRLTWIDNSMNESAFEVWRCAGSNCTTFSNVAILPANTTKFNDVSVSRGTTYLYKARAANSGGASGWSNTASAAAK